MTLQQQIADQELTIAAAESLIADLLDLVDADTAETLVIEVVNNAD